MGDGSRSSLVKSLKGEWNLLWESLAGDKDESASVDSDDAFETGKLKILSIDQINEITKNLSEDRKKLNQKIEKLQKEIELNSAKLESLRLVGSPDQSTLKRIVELTDLGQSLAEQLEKIDQKIRSARQLEDGLKRNLVSS